LSFVLDSSVALSWCFADEFTAETDALLERAKVETLFVASVWPYEMVNTLERETRRGRIPTSELDEFLQLLECLDIRVADSLGVDEMYSFLHTTERVGLTAYDASYLVLAQSLALPLATLDRRLAKSAARQSVSLIVKL
jgi:predicted nucleic acid-binding protein